ncbi:hypothetical protein PTW32_01670 [Dechloromonas agitata]|nr:hypothetical protein [Dechloromonas agitata]MDE1544110.1 hypothetical protein [Dechloromonas agitata]
MPLEQQLLDRITLDDRGALCEVAHFLCEAERAMQAADELIDATKGAGR